MRIKNRKKEIMEEKKCKIQLNDFMRSFFNIIHLRVHALESFNELF